MKVFTFLLTLVFFVGCAKDSKPAETHTQHAAIYVSDVDFSHGLIVDKNGDGIIYPNTLNVALRVDVVDASAWKKIIEFEFSTWTKNCESYVDQVQYLRFLEIYSRAKLDYENATAAGHEFYRMKYVPNGGSTTSFEYDFESDQYAQKIFDENKEKIKGKVTNVRSIRALRLSDIDLINRQYIYVNNSVTELFGVRYPKGNIELSHLPAYSFCDLVTGYITFKLPIGTHNVAVQLKVSESPNGVKPNQVR